MKLDRLIGILSILQKGGSVTAPQLAERFEVSRRTISRDIEELCRAGIPIATTQGRGGGIALMEGGLVDTTIFTGAELRAIWPARVRLTASPPSRAPRRSRQLAPDGTVSALADDIIIDLASFYKGSLTEKNRAFWNRR